MKPGQVIRIKKDNRYKDGNIVVKNGVFVGNQKTVQVTPMHDLAPVDRLPPIRISMSLYEALKREGFLNG